MTATPSNPAQRCQPSMAEPTRAELIAALKATYRNFMATGADRESDERYEDWVDTIKNLYAPPCATLKARVAELEANEKDTRRSALKEAMEIVGSMRQSEACLFDEKHSGQRGCDRLEALHDAYVAIRAALSHAGPVARDGGK
jgi:hypothetical protein